MAKKVKPSLKDYLRTGKRSMPGPEAAEQAPRSGAFLELLAPPDLAMWQSMLAAGIKVELRHLDPADLKEDFRSIDKSRFTCYALAGKGEPLRPVRSDAQISDPLALLLKWDETGALTVYDPNV